MNNPRDNNENMALTNHIMKQERHFGVISKEEWDTIKARRERAYMWHMRWAMPTYDRMIKTVKESKGLDITVEDVDLLPWGANGRAAFRQEYQRMQNEEYQPNARNKKQQQQEDEDRKAKEEEERRRREAEEAERRRKEAEEAERKRREAEEAERLRREAEEAERRRKEAEEAERLRREAEEAERLRREEEARRQLPPKPTDGNSPIERAYRWYVDLKKPTRGNMIAAIQKTTGMDIDKSDVDKLPWNADGKTLNYPKLHDYLEEATGRKPDVMQEQDEPLLNITPKQPADANDLDQIESILKAYDWYKDLNDPKLKTYRAVQEETSGCTATKEAVLSLPWDPTQNYVDPKKMKAWQDRYDELQEEQRRKAEEAERRRREAEEAERRRREAEEARRKEAERRRKEEEERKKLPPKPTDGNTPVERAYRWYVDLKKPTRDNMVAAIQKTTGMDIDKSDVDKLPWNKDGQTLNYPKLHDYLEKATGRKPDVMEEVEEPLLNTKPRDPADANDLEQCAEILKAYDWYKDLKDPKLKTYRAVQDETTGCDATKEAVLSLPWDPTQTFVDPKKMKEWQKQFKELEAEKRRREADAEARRRAEHDLAKRRAENHDRAQRLAERNRSRLQNYSLEEANAKREKCYMWYARMGQPNKNKMKKLVANLPESCDDICVDDVDLLPWTCAGLALDVHKMNKLITGEDLDNMKADLRAKEDERASDSDSD